MSKPERDDSDEEFFEAASVPAPAAGKALSARERLDVIEQELVPEDHYGEAPPRSLQSKLFGIGFSGWSQLVVVCVIVGAILQAGGIDFFAPNFTFTGFAGSVGRGVLSVLGWAMEVGWQPLLAGSIVVIPLWLAWRLLTVPFRN